MDCLFNWTIPKTKPCRVIVPPINKTFITGISTFYHCDYPEEILNGFVSKKEFERVLGEVNDKIYSSWPCMANLAFGYC